VSDHVRRVPRLLRPLRPRLGSIDIELTERCDNDCIHCCINRPASDSVARAGELATDQVKDVVRQAADLGCLQVRYTGGEPLLRPDFEELYLHARRLGMRVLVFTNARRLTPRLADLLVRVPPLVAVEVSVYGMHAQSYEAVTRVPGSFAQFRRGVDLLLGRGIPFVIKGALLPPNRREIDELTELARRFGARGLVHLAVQAGGELHGPIAKFLAPEMQAAIRTAAGANENDLILVVADHGETANEVLGRLRVELGGRLGLADPNELAYCWVHHFPMYQWDEPFKRWDATHNPFSGVVPEDEVLLTTTSGSLDDRDPGDPAGRAKAMQYDVALNGWELGGGSVRIWKPDLLARSFNLQGYSIEQMRERFGAILEAFEYGAPPHGGIALGVDRWAALLSYQTNIREVMAFPKTQSGSDLMLEAPSAPDAEQLEELGLRFVGVPEKR